MKKTTCLFSSLLLATALGLSMKPAAAQNIECKPVNINLGTGIDNAGAILLPGTPDPNWQNAQGLGNVATPNSGWDALTGSAWLGNGSSATGGINYTFTRNFSLPGAGTISFQSLADNYVTIFLDGNQIAQTPGLNAYGFQLPYVVTYSGSVGAGAHTLQAVVYNHGGPSGFNLSGSASYSPTPVTFDISTATGGTLPIGTFDPDWQNFQGLNIVVGPYGGWDALTGSNWLGDHSWTNNPPGTYTFTRSFTTSGPGSITFEALADNNVVIELDGVPVAQTPGGSMYGFQLAQLASYSGLLSAGTHTLSAHVYNQEGPIGFNLHGSVTHCSDPAGPTKCDVNPDFTAAANGFSVLDVDFSSSNDPVNTPGPGNIITHSWDFGDGNTSSLANPSHTYAAVGTYTVTHTILRQILDAHGGVIDECKETRVCRLSIREGKLPGVTLICRIFEPIERTAAPAPGVSLYPNPARTTLTVRSEAAASELQIFSVDGREMLHRRLSDQQTTIDIAGLPAGTYQIRVSSGAGVSNLRFIKIQ